MPAPGTGAAKPGTGAITGCNNQFAKNFAPDVLILEPKRLADQVCAEAERTLAAYRELM